MTETVTETLARLRATKDQINGRLGYLYYRRHGENQEANTQERIQLVHERSDIYKAIAALTIGSVKNNQPILCGHCGGALNWRGVCGVCEGMARIRAKLVETRVQPEPKARRERPRDPAWMKRQLGFGKTWEAGADKSMPTGDR